MNTNRFTKLSRFARHTVVAAGFVAAAASAHAGGVYWAVNVATPVGVSTSVSNTRHGVYGPAVAYAPAPVVYAPPVYVQPRPVYVQPRPVYVPAPVVYEEARFCPPRWGWHHRHHHRMEERYAWNDDGWRGGERMEPRGGYERDDRGGQGGWRRDR